MKRVARPSSLTFPKAFRARLIAANGTKLYVRVGGSGAAVLLLHGYGETGDMWVPLADNLARDRTVVVPDLRGMGLSAKPASGYDKKSKPTTSPASSMRSRSSVQHSSPTTSATWSATPSPRSTVTA
jgi:pimeloyl-ACP methyl ester carboxylesterase